MASRVKGSFSKRPIMRWRPDSERLRKVSTSTAQVLTSVIMSATQPMMMETFIDENEPAVRVPVRLLYTSMNTGRIKATAKAKITLMMANSAAG